MAGFDRRRTAGIDDRLTYIGRGAIGASLFDLGLYPAAVPAPDTQVWGEVYEVRDAEAVLAALDEIEGYRPERSRSEPLHPAAGRGAPAGRIPLVGVGLLLQRAARPGDPHHVRRLPRTHQGALTAGQLRADSREHSKKSRRLPAGSRRGGDERQRALVNQDLRGDFGGHLLVMRDGHVEQFRGHREGERDRLAGAGQLAATAPWR